MRLTSRNAVCRIWRERAGMGDKKRVLNEIYFSMDVRKVKNAMRDFFIIKITRRKFNFSVNQMPENL